MPESPEVQALADQVGERLAGSTLTAVDVLEFRVIKTRARQPESLVGERVTGARRYGKLVDLEFGDTHLVISLGRHGWARWGDAELPPDPPPALALLDFDDGNQDDGTRDGGTQNDGTQDDGSRLELTDAGGWVSLGTWVVDDPLDVSTVATLGPDPADPGYTRADFDRAFKGRRKQLKAILEEQKSISGIGNAYSDEILFAARLNPVAHSSDLGDEELDRLYEHTVAVIRSATDARRGIPIADLKAAKTEAMQVHGRTGEPCPDCEGTILDFAFASTTAQYCPSCQTGGVILPV
jgi:formamidopyrimidine-DNA glycosylase